MKQKIILIDSNNIAYRAFYALPDTIMTSSGIMTNAVLEDLPVNEGDEVSVLVNGLGATPPIELYILYRKIHDIIRDRGISIYKAFVGEYATSMEMAGCSLTLLKLNEECKRLLDAPWYSPFVLQKH